MGFLDNFRRADSKPNTGAPRGSSGRAHSNGFLDFEEFNYELRHPTCHRVYDRMYRTDGDVRGVIGLVSNPILGGTWQVIPHGGEDATPEDVAIADFVQWALFKQMSPNWLGHLAQFIPVVCRSGFCPGEKVWMPVDYEGSEKLVIKTIGLRLPRSIWRFDQGNDGRLRGVQQQLAIPHGSAGFDVGENVRTQGGGSDSLSVYIPSKDLVYYRVGAEGDNWEGVSMLRPAFKHWKMKDAIERLDAIAQEREAVGIPVLYPPPGASPDQLDDMESVLQSIRTNEQGYVVMPGPKAGMGSAEGTGWNLELMGYDRSGSGRDPQPSLQYHTQKIAAAFIAEFMRLGHGSSGARATGQTQVEPFLMGIEALTGVIEQEANTNIIAPLVAYNYAKVVNPPKLQMSLVDSTSLTQLADYVLKLTQVGALLPDQELEDFLRARADLPPANPDEVKKRKDEAATRRAIMGVNAADPTGGIGGAGQDTFGSNDPKNRGQQHGDKKGGVAAPPPKKGNPSGSGAKGSGAPRGPNKELAVDMGQYHRPLRPPEYVLDLDGMERELDSAGDEMHQATVEHIMALASQGGDSSDLHAAIAERLAQHYQSGRDHVASEIALPGYVGLARHVPPDTVGRHAELGAKEIAHAIATAHEHSSVANDSKARAQASAERAGAGAAKRVGRVQGTAAFMAGRHDMALDNSGQILGARYVSLLDHNTCMECEAADDDQVRAMDDPVRLDRRPPNHHCDSNASGRNLCRCFELYEPMPPDSTALDASEVPNDPAKTNWVEKAGGLPPFIAAIAGDLITGRGMEPGRAIAVAIARCKLWAMGGGRVRPGTQMKAAAAIAQWEQMKAG